jgi:sugar phosphate isomerase/epimerase
MIRTSRRQFLAAGAALSTAVPRVSRAAGENAAAFRYCLNTATLQGYKLPITQQIDVAGKAGFQAIEPWVSNIHSYVSEGGSLPDLKRRIADLGLTVESAIAFPQWVVDDPAKRDAGLEQAKRDIDVVARIGGKRIAAPPAGAPKGAEISLPQIVERYRKVLELGDQMNVVAELEFWGTSPVLSRLAQAVFVAMESHHPKACVLADMFHLYKGESGLEGLRMLGPQALQVFHMNDYPATPPRDTVTDRDRVFPGDGVAPLKQVLTDLHRVNPALVLSLEVFNPAYWKGDPLETAKTGLAKMKQAVQALN